jgi:nucleoside-diphosphate-sugar epimerase
MTSSIAIHQHDLVGQAVLVTGAGGCIGAWVIKMLHDLGATPIAFDLSENRERLHLIFDHAQDVVWEQGDITNYDRLREVVNKHQIEAIIHLAALQVPFCKADPVGSTRVNIMGAINILECARQTGIKRISYASSVAAPAMANTQWLSTLYGAHKVCGEQMAAVYWQDWQVASVGIRPSIIYGPGRDQGMSAAPTIAMLAAFAGKPYTIPFSGNVAYVHVEDAAARFIAAISKPVDGAHVFDMTGTSVDTKIVIDLIRAHYPDSNIQLSGEEMPFPADLDDGKLDKFLAMQPCRSFEHGTQDTFAEFAGARQRGALSNDDINRLIAKNS